VPRSSAERVRWCALALVALVPRLAGALLRRAWHDEYFTAWAVRLSLHDLVAALRLDSGPPLPYVLAKAVAATGLEPVAAARAISVAAGTGAVLLGARAAGRAFGPRAGWWTGALLAVHPLAVAWSCEGRAYALVMLAAAWAWDRVASLGESGRGATGLALAVSLACWSHGLGMLLAVVLALAALTLAPPSRLRGLAAVGAGLASHLPWLPVALHQPAAAVAWMTAAWRAIPLAGRIAAPVRMLSPGAAFATAVDVPSSPAWLEALAALALVALVAAGSRARGSPRFALGLALPVVILGVLAFLGVPAFYPGRGEVLAIVPLAALAGVTAGSHRFGALAGAALVAVGATTVGRAEVAWAATPVRDEQQIADTLRRAMPSGGVVLVGGYWRLGVAYHLGARAPFELVSVPEEAARHPGWFDAATDRPGPGELDRLRERLAGSQTPVALVIPRSLPGAGELSGLAAWLGGRPLLSIGDTTVVLCAHPASQRSGS